MTEFERERELWARDVDHEAARLVREGFAPYDAMERARGIVSSRRRALAKRDIPSYLCPTCKSPDCVA